MYVYIYILYIYIYIFWISVEKSLKKGQKDCYNCYVLFHDNSLFKGLNIPGPLMLDKMEDARNAVLAQNIVFVLLLHKEVISIVKK